MIFINYYHVLFFVNSVSWNSISDEGEGALLKMKQEINSKRTPNEDKLKIDINF